MKKILILPILISLMICLLMNIQIFAQEENNDFRKAKWGMSISEVKGLEVSKIFNEDKSTLTFSGKLSGFDVVYVFVFVQDKLVRGSYVFINKHTNATDFYNDFLKINELLTKKYEKSYSDDVIWKDDLYRNKPQDWGMAIITGDVVFQTVWELPKTKILHILKGDNYKKSHILQYSSKDLADLEEKEKEKEALDDL